MSVWLGLLVECTALTGAVSTLLRRRRPWRGALPLVGGALFVAADLFYEMRSEAYPRYPYNYGVECIYLGALLCVGVWLSQLLLAADGAHPPPSARAAGAMRAVGISLAAALTAAIGFAEWHYLLTPLAGRDDVGAAGWGLAMAYASLHAFVTALVILAAVRTLSIGLYASLHGLGCMLAGDFASRFAALACDNSFGMGTFWWTLGLAGFVAALAVPRACQATAYGGASEPGTGLTPTASVQVIVASSTSATVGALLLGAKRHGWLFCAHAEDFGHLLLCCWLAFAAMTGLSLFLGCSLRRGAHLLPRPRLQLRGEHHRLALRIPKAALRLSEMQILARAHRTLLLELTDLVRYARRRAAQAKVGLLAAEWVHELQAPLAAMEAATSLNGPHASHADTTASRQLLTRALQRARRLSARILHSTELAQSVAPRMARSPLRRPRARVTFAKVEKIVQRAMAEARQRHGPNSPLLVLRCRRTRAAQHRQFVSRSEHLYVALGALIDNAIEASAGINEPVEIHLTYRWHQAALAVAVVDRGTGLPPAMLLQAGRSRLPSSKIRGHGIGLLAAARRAASWGGALVCYRRRVGGARVELLLPLVLARRSIAAAQAAVV